MLLKEAIETLKKNGYDVVPLDEGRVGRTLGAIGIALSSLFGHAHASIDNLDLKTATTEDIQEIKKAFEQEGDIDYCKLKGKGLVCKDTNNTVTIYPTKTLKNIGISDDITEIIFLDGYKNKEKLEGVVFNYKDGSKKSITHKIGEKYGYETKLDEFDTEINKNIISIAKVENLKEQIYNNIVNEFGKVSKSEVEHDNIKNIEMFSMNVPENIFSIIKGNNYISLDSDEIPAEIGGSSVKYNNKTDEYIKCKNLKSIGQMICTIYDSNYNEKTFATYNREGHLISVKDINSGNEFSMTSSIIKPGYKINDYMAGVTGFLLTDNGTKEIYIKDGKIIKTVTISD